MQAFVEKIEATLTVATSWMSVLRIVCWAVLTVVVLSVPFKPVGKAPALFGLETPAVQQMMLSRDDPLWTLTEPDPFPADNKLNIAWISGSGGLIKQGKDYAYVPEETLPHLSEDAKVWFYYIEGARTVESFTAELDAIRRKPDVLVLEINPIWAFNNLELRRSGNVLNAGSNLWSYGEHLPLKVFFASPSEHLHNTIARHLPRIPNNYGQRLSGLVSRLLSRTPAESSAAGASDKLDGGALSQGAQYWLSKLVTDEELNSYSIDGKLTAANLQAAVMMRSNLRDETWASWLLDKQISAARDSGLPVVVYLAPVDRKNLQNPALLSMYEAVQDKVRLYKPAFDSPTRRLLVDYPDEVQQSIDQKDYIHLSRPGLFPAYMAQQILEVTSADE